MDQSARSAGEILATAEGHGPVCPEDALPLNRDGLSMRPRALMFPGQKTGMLGSSLLPGEETNGGHPQKTEPVLVPGNLALSEFRRVWPLVVHSRAELRRQLGPVAWT